MSGSKSRVLSVVMVVGVLVAALGAGLSPASARPAAASDVHCDPKGCVDARDLAAGAVKRGKIAAGAVSGGKIADGTVSEADLSFDPLSLADLEGYVSEAELDDMAAALATGDGSAPNTGRNLVHWQNIVGMPAGFADGNDEAGSGGSAPAPSGPATDVACTGCVGGSDLAADSITSDKIVDGTVTRSDLAFDSGTATSLECTGCVGRDDLAGDSVNGDKIEDGTVTRDDLAFDPSQASDLECQGCVDSGDVQNGSIQEEDLGFTPSTTASDVVCDACVDTADLAENAVTSGKVAQGTIRGEATPGAGSATGDIGLRTITSDNIAADTITANELRAGSIESSEIKDGNVLSVDLAGTYDPFASFAETVPGAVTSEKIKDGTILARDIDTGAVTSEKIFDGTVNSQDIAAGAVTTQKMTANAQRGGVSFTAPTDTGTPQASTFLSVPPGANHLVQLSGQVQVTCACATNGTPDVSWYLTREVGGVTEVITPAYTEDLSVTDAQLVATITWLDTAAPGTVTYELKTSENIEATDSSTISYSNAILIATDLGQQ